MDGATGMILVVNYVPKLQAVDKSVATLAALRRQRGDVAVVTIVSIHSKNQIPSSRFLFDILAEVSDAGVIVGRTALNKEAEDAFIARRRPSETVTTVGGSLVTPFVSQATGAAVDRTADAVAGNEPRQSFLFLPFTDDSTGLGGRLARNAHERGDRVIAYFKSMHDEGFGFTTHAGNMVPPGSGLGARLRAGYRTGAQALRAVRRLSKHAARGQRTYLKINPSDVDCFLAYNRVHANVLRARLGEDAQVAITGYPLLYPAWRTIIEESAAYRAFKRMDYEVVIFTRGETPGRPPHENVLPHATLRALLADMFEELDAKGRRVRIRVKPHPIQDARVVEDIIRGRRNVVISYDAPSLLAATADLAISTYSSTVVDALIFGVPSIEYYVENEFFRRKHPGGSPFPALGALKARNRDEFRACLVTARSPDYRVPDMVDALDHKEDLSVFEHSEVKKDS